MGKQQAHWGMPVCYHSSWPPRMSRRAQPFDKEICIHTRSVYFFISDVLGWGNWTEWSLCDSNNEQHRKRKCFYENPGSQMCQGKDIEIRMCSPEDINGKLFMLF